MRFRAAADILRGLRLAAPCPRPLAAELCRLGQVPKARAEIVHRSRVRQNGRDSRGSASEQLLYTRPSQNVGGAGCDAIDPAMQLLDGEAVDRRRLADLDLQPRAWPSPSIQPSFPGRARPSLPLRRALPLRSLRHASSRAVQPRDC